MNPWIQEDEKIETKLIVEKNDDMACLKSLEVLTLFMYYIKNLNYEHR
jgi:hypothetical protein